MLIAILLEILYPTNPKVPSPDLIYLGKLTTFFAIMTGLAFWIPQRTEFSKLRLFGVIFLDFTALIAILLLIHLLKKVVSVFFRPSS